MAGPGGQEVGRISVRVVPNTEHFRRELKAQLEAIEEGLKVEVPVDPDMAGFRQKVKAATSNLPDAKVKVDAEGDLNKAVKALNDKGTTKFKLEVDDQFDYRLRQRLAKINPTIKAKVDVDQSVLSRITSRISKTLSGVEGPRFGTGFTPTTYVALAAAALAVAAPAVGLITTALLAVPGVVAAVLTPIAALALGMDGLKKAAESIKAPFDDLKATMSSRVQEQFTPAFEKLRDIFPTLKNALPVVSQGVADLFKSFTNAVTSPENLKTIESTIRNIGTAISNAAPGIGSFTTGFLNLANSLSQKFPSIATWFNEAGDSFDKWITKLTDPAQGTAGIGAGLAGGKSQLTTAFEGLGTTIKTILDGLGQIAERGFEFMKDPSKIDSFAGALGKVAGALERIVAASDKLQDFDKKFQEKFADPFENNVLGQKDVPEFKDPQASWWDKVKASKLGEAFKPENLLGQNDFSKGLWEKIKAGFDPKNLFGDIKLGMATAAAETGQQAGSALGQSLGQGFQTAQASGGAAAIQTQVQQIGPQIQQALAGATAQLQSIPGQIQQAFSGIGAAVTGSMATVVGAVAGAGQQIVAAFTGSLSQIPAIATQAFASVQAAAAAGMANVVTAITSGAAQAVAAVQAMGQQIIAAMQSAASGAQAAGAQIGAGMAAGIRSSTGQAVAAAQALAAAVTAAAQVKLGIKSPSKVFTEIGSQTAQGLQNGLEGGFQGVIERATSLTQQLTDAVNGGLEGVNGKVLSDGIKRQIDELELQRKQLQVQKDAIPKEDKEGRKGIQSQMDQISALKNQLGLQKDQLGFSQKYGESTDSVAQANNIITEQLAKMIDLGKGFFQAQTGQLMTDLGMSGQGAVPTIANTMLDWGASALSKGLSSAFTGGGTTINVNSVDDALAARQNIVNKDALRYKQR